MSDPFRRLFLDQVDIIIKKDPSREVLLTLLQLATPGLTSLGSDTETKKTFKALLLRVHPDKHPDDNQRATRICQDVKTFYDDCLAATPVRKKKKKKRSSKGPSPNTTGYALDFDVINKWSHIQYDSPYLKPQMTSQDISIAVAYQCINARGAIAHGRKIELHYSNDQVDESTETSVKKLFKYSSTFGGAKELNSIEDIKDELIKNGPVVSTSFCPSSAFVSNNSIQQRDILIVGWKQLPSGEVWILQPLYHHGDQISQVVYVGIGKYGIDDCCLAPKSSLENTPWQSGPYFDIVRGYNEWQSWPGMVCYEDSVDFLFKEIGTISLGDLSDAVVVTI